MTAVPLWAAHVGSVALVIYARGLGAVSSAQLSAIGY